MAKTSHAPSPRCPQCGETFEPTRPGQRFCRPSCRRAHFTRKPQQLRLPLGEAGDLFAVPFEDDHQVGDKC